VRYDDERFHTNLRRSGARRLAAGDEVADAADDAGLFPEEPRAGAHDPRHLVRCNAFG